MLDNLLCYLSFSACDEKKDEGNLKMENVGGVFVVLGCGLIIAFIVAIIEFLLNVGKIAVEQKVIIEGVEGNQSINFITVFLTSIYLLLKISSIFYRFLTGLPSNQNSLSHSIFSSRQNRSEQAQVKPSLAANQLHPDHSNHVRVMDLKQEV